MATPQLYPTPPQKKEPLQVPDEQMLRNMIASGMSSVVEQLIETHKLPYKVEDGALKDALVGTELHLKSFITQDEKCLLVKERVRKVAKVDDEVLITGDSGTGKETLAKAMIGLRVGKFIPINCAGLPRELIESELFGHVKGAFTGAESQKQGMLAAAHEGVIFLDEIAELPLDVQGKLLRALQTKKVRMVGSNNESDISCKFVCATHRNLKKMVKDNLFREDLYARISVFEIHIPSLAERRGDIFPIIKSMRDGQRYLDAFTQAGHAVGEIDVSLNVRSLQRYVRRLAVLGELCYT